MDARDIAGNGRFAAGLSLGAFGLRVPDVLVGRRSEQKDHDARFGPSECRRPRRCVATKPQQLGKRKTSVLRPPARSLRGVKGLRTPRWLDLPNEIIGSLPSIDATPHATIPARNKQGESHAKSQVPKATIWVASLRLCVSVSSFPASFQHLYWGKKA